MAPQTSIPLSATILGTLGTILVRPVDTTSDTQPPHQIHRGFAGGRGVPVGNLWSPFREVCGAVRVEYTYSGKLAWM